MQADNDRDENASETGGRFRVTLDSNPNFRYMTMRPKRLERKELPSVPQDPSKKGPSQSQ